jgi:hypothetical protein
MTERGAFICEPAGGVALYDISYLLPRHHQKRYRERSRAPTALFVHHSGADSALDGLEAFKAMATYHVYTKQWPGIAYHYGVGRRPEWDDQGRRVVYRLQPEPVRCYHTKGRPNSIGCGLVLQGHLGRHPLTSGQVELLEAVIPWWMAEHGRSPQRDLGWHSNSWKWGGIPKPACPGRYAVEWLRGYVGAGSDR